MQAGSPESYGSRNDPGTASIPDAYNHPRAAIQRKDGYWNSYQDKPRSDVINYECLYVMYGTSPRNITRTHRLVDYRDRHQWRADKGQTRVSFYVVPLPTESEKYMWVDLNLPVRGLYLPVSFEGDLEFPDLSKWIKVDFRFRTSSFNIGVYNDANVRTSIGQATQNLTTGWRKRLNYTLRVDTFALLELLVLDAWLRRPGKTVYAPDDRITFVPSNSFNIALPNLPTTAIRNYNVGSERDAGWNNNQKHTHQAMANSDGLMITKMVSYNQNVSIQYAPATAQKKIDFIFKLLSFGSGFIPGVGPLLAAGMDMGIAIPDAAGNGQNTGQAAGKNSLNFLKEIMTIAVSASSSKSRFGHGKGAIDQDLIQEETARNGLAELGTTPTMSFGDENAYLLQQEA